MQKQKTGTPRRSSTKLQGAPIKADVERRSSIRTPKAHPSSGKVEPLMQQRTKTAAIAKPASHEESDNSPGTERKSLLGIKRSLPILENVEESQKKPQEQVLDIPTERLDELFLKRSYSQELKEADAGEFEEYKPLVERVVNVPIPIPKEQLARENDVKNRQQVIENAYKEVEQYQIANYQNTFNEAVEKDMVVLAEVGVDEIDQEQRRIEEERIKNAKVEAEEFEKQRIEMMKLQEEAKTELFHRNQVLAKELERAEMDAILRARQRRAILNKAFMKAEANLHNSIKASGGYIETKYKELIIDQKSQSANLAKDSKAREFKVRWKSAPQLLHLRIELCRCLRDKIGEGRCAVLCSVLDRIGGNVLDYQDKQRSRRWKRITSPKHHEGKYTDEALRFEESLMLVAPSKFVATPSMVVLFELFLLKSKSFSHDQVFGWGVFPLLNNELEYNKGRFKIPLLYGPVDNEIKKYGDIERSIRENLDTWLCNLYFSVESREPLNNPYTTQLDLDNEAHNKIAQVLDIDGDNMNDIERNGINSGQRYQQPQADQSASMLLPYNNEKADLLNNNSRIAELLREDDDDDEFNISQGGKRVYNPLVKPEDFDEYNYHIPRLEFRSRVSFTSQVTYIVDEVLADLGFRNVLSFEFWCSAFILLLAMWSRSYIHPFGSWLFLKISGIPVTEFTPELYGFSLEYPMSTVGAEIGVILFGNISVTLVYLFFIFICWFLERYINGTPNLIYKFVAAFGISVVADFLLLAVVDLAVDNKTGEIWKLYNFYDKIDKTGVIGLFITLFIYFGICVLNCFIFYAYIVFLHMDGRMIDLYTRVSADRDHFFVPYDNEISARALRQVLEKVKRENNSLKGTPGMKHVAITHHEISCNEKNEKSSYIALYEKCSDNRLELFRHFVRLSNGSICELEQKLAYSVDDYPLFEEAAPNPRNRLISELSGIPIMEEEKKVQFVGEDIMGSGLSLHEITPNGDSGKNTDKDQKGHYRAESFMEPSIVITGNQEAKNEEELQ